MPDEGKELLSQVGDLIGDVAESIETVGQTGGNLIPIADKHPRGVLLLLGSSIGLFVVLAAIAYAFVNHNQEKPLPIISPSIVPGPDGGTFRVPR